MSIVQRGKNTWRITVPTGKVNGEYQRITETFHGLKSEAKARENELKQQVKNGNILVSKKMTFAEFSERWLNEYAINLAPRTYNEYKKLLQKINVHIGSIPLQDLKPLHLTEYYNKLRAIGKEQPHNKFNKSESNNKPLSENTVLHHYNLIGGILHKAVDWDCLGKNPNDRVPRPKIKKHEPNFYDVNQVQELIKCLDEESLKYRTLIMLALDTGARRGEITGLEWDDIDFSNNCITINKITQRVNGKIIEKPPKTNSSIRKLQITSVTASLLKEYKHAQLLEELRLGSKWIKTKKVFTGEFGGPMPPETPSHIFENILKKHNLPKLKFHELRHTSVSLLINAGIQTQMISKRVGHSSVTTTSDIYGHIFNNTENEATQKLNEILTANQ